ncbi:hypothetical protein [Eubacterium sp. ER2]|uniref:hypothetical protein n=1 Tax=Eubacterium sp. ER2 TaxID=1519438 RepID=UPI00051C6C07|nr:hypothetical protein [Eubacterium sp. ER2]
MKKKVLSLCAVFMILFATAFQSYAADDIAEGEKNVNDYETLGEMIQDLDPAAYYSFSDNIRFQMNTIKLEDIEEGNESIQMAPTNRQIILPYAAAISSDVSSSGVGHLAYSGTLEASEVSKSLYLGATASESITGTVVSAMGNTRYNSTKVTVANARTGLISGRRYQVYFYGVVEAPAGYYPPSGVVTSTKYINIL